MTDESKRRINQWFIRGIGLIVSGLFVLIITISLLDLDSSLFHSGETIPESFDFIILVKQIGMYLWTFRVLDLLLILIIILLGIISAYYFVAYKHMISKPIHEQREKNY
ncbi:MAG: hypothetical protein JXA54_04025 [Candidatus Heimdallarchaeota archaeon]|nr:hypothetical protein [Candidatus Heimdallarchaeota archaeon]